MVERLDSAAVDRVLKRAIELDEDPATDEALDTDALTAVAEEVGISRAAVRRSVAIERLGPAPGQGRLDRLVGPPMVVVERQVPYNADEAFDRLDEWLSRHHRLRRVRRDGLLGEWRKRTDFAATVSRSARGLSGGAELGSVRSLHAHVVGVEDNAAMIRVTVVRRTARNASASVSGGAGAASVGVTAAAVVTTSPLAILAAPLAAIGGVAALASKRAAARLERDLTRLLDQLHEGRTPGRRRRRRKHSRR